MDGGEEVAEWYFRFKINFLVRRDLESLCNVAEELFLP